MAKSGHSYQRSPAAADAAAANHVRSLPRL